MNFWCYSEKNNHNRTKATNTSRLNDPLTKISFILLCFPYTIHLQASIVLVIIILRILIIVEIIVMVVVEIIGVNIILGTVFVFRPA